MTHFEYTMMTEQAAPQDLVAHVVRAEEVGFDFSVTSDHYFPWLDEQGTPPTRGACWERPRRPLRGFP